MMSCHLIPVWHQWNVNADDVMTKWFTLYVNPVTSHLACTMHAIHALCRTRASKYFSGLACMQADVNLVKITPTHFGY